jgi:hypothetical protein
MRCCCSHSAGASINRASPMPRGSRPSTAALTSDGARNASEIVMLTWRALQSSRIAMSSIVAVPASISDNQSRPRARMSSQPLPSRTVATSSDPSGRGRNSSASGLVR